jgi:hypothetical protein
MPYPSTVDANLVQEWMLGSDALEMGAGGTTGVAVANTVYVIAVTVRGTTTISNMRTHVGSTATGHTDMGLYDVNGNQLAHTGAVVNVASTPNTNALIGGNYTLSPGNYYLAMCCDNSTDTYSRMNTLGVPGALSTTRFATNTGTAGVLPATLGTILAPNGPIPVFCAVAVNGLP